MGNSRSVPGYDNSVGIQVVDQPNPAGSAEMMINSFRNFADTTNSITEGISKEVADQQRETLKNNISNTYRGFALTALNNPDQSAALVQFNRDSKQYAAGLMEQTNRFNKPYVSNLVDYYHNEHQYTIEKNSIAQNQRVLSVEAYKNLNDSTRDWEDAINNSKPMIDENGEDHQFDASRALFADQMRNMEKYAKLNFIDSSTMGRARNELIKKYQTSEYLKRFQDSVEQGNGNDFISKLEKPGYSIPGMNANEKYQVINQMINIRDQGHRGATIALGQLKYDMDDDLLNIKNGAMPNQELLSQVRMLDPIKADNYAEQQEIAQSEWSAKQATQFKSPSERADYKKRLYDEIDYSTPEAAKKRRIADASVKAIDEQDKEIRANPLDFVMRNPAIKNAVNEYEQAFNAGAVGQDHKYTPFNSKVQKPWNSIIQEQLHIGMTLNGKNEKSVRLIDPSEIGTKINEVMQVPALDKVVYMNKLSDEFGGGLPFKLALKQMIAAGLPRNYSLLADIDPNSPDAARIAESVSVPASEVAKELKSRNPKGIEYIRATSLNNVFNLGSGGTDNFKMFLSTVPQYSDQINVQYKGNLSSDIAQIANYYALTQNMTPEESLNRAEDIMANRYDYSSINASMIRLPKTVSEESVKAYAARKQSDLSAFKFNLEGVDKARSERAIKYGHWANDSNDDGLVWVDADGKMWADKNGHPYGFSFREAQIGHPEPNFPMNQAAQKLQTQNEIDSGSQPYDEQLNEIDRRGKMRLDYLKSHQSLYGQLMKSTREKN